MKGKKIGHIEVRDTKSKKGIYFLRIIGANGEPLMNGEPLTTPANVKKQIRAVAEVFDVGRLIKSGWVDITDSPMERLGVIDHTKSQIFARKHGAVSGKGGGE